MSEKSDLLVSAPSKRHYSGFAIEPLQYIEANAIPFHEGNVIKYVSRWREKGGLDDLKKARFYVERLIELAEGEKGVEMEDVLKLGEEVTLWDLRPGAIFVTREGIYAVKSEYIHPDNRCECVLLASGEYAHFKDGNKTLVREVRLGEL